MHVLLLLAISQYVLITPVYPTTPIWSFQMGLTPCHGALYAHVNAGDHIYYHDIVYSVHTCQAITYITMT